MPLIGYFLGINFEKAITNVDHWIAFGLLTVIGINMIKEAYSKEKEESNKKAQEELMQLLKEMKSNNDNLDGILSHI